MKSMLIYVTLLLLIGQSSLVTAQSRSKIEERTGIIKEVEKKGRSRVLIVTIDGEDHEFAITPKVTLQVKLSGGTEAAIQRGAYLEGMGPLTNNRVFLESVNIRVLPNGARPPESRMMKPEMLAPGQSVNSQKISGLIMSRQTSKDYPEYEEVLLKPAANVPPIFFKKEITVEIISNDPDQIHGGESVELQVIPGRNDKLTLVSAVVSGGAYTPPQEK